jgi:hypothetical protein
MESAAYAECPMPGRGWLVSAGAAAAPFADQWRSFAGGISARAAAQLIISAISASLLPQSGMRFIRSRASAVLLMI